MKNNSELGYYLAGLMEGDGNIWTQRTIRSPTGRIINPQIMYTFHKKDKPLYEHIKNVLGGGTFYHLKNSNACRYKICDKNTLIKTINLINGKFRTPKIDYLYKAIDYLNYVHNADIQKLPLDRSNILDSPWLAGITDADGNFHISLIGIYKSIDSLDRGRIICSYTLKQRMIDKATNLSCIPFMANIAKPFGSNINFKGVNELVFVVQANNKHHLIKSYFNKFSLMSSKHLEYLSYLKALNYLSKSLNKEEILEIQNIKNSMNNKRTYFNWDHLNNFYK